MVSQDSISYEDASTKRWMEFKLKLAKRSVKGRMNEVWVPENISSCMMQKNPEVSAMAMNM